VSYSLLLLLLFFHSFTLHPCCTVCRLDRHPSNRSRQDHRHLLVPTHCLALPCPVLPAPATAPCTIHFLAVLRIDSPSCRWRERNQRYTCQVRQPRSKSLAHAHATHLSPIHQSPATCACLAPCWILVDRIENRVAAAGPSHRQREIVIAHPRSPPS
jgi:hypothetical protein